MPCSADEGSTRGQHAWWLFGLGLLLLPSVAVRAGGALAARLLDAEPALLWQEPWRCWSAAWVHWSLPHLQANLAGGALLLLLGHFARMPRRAVTAWALAWPVLHLGVMLLQPSLRHYGGLSGTLHAGVAVVVIWLLRAPDADRRTQLIGAGLLAGLLLKLMSERFWALSLPYSDALQITTVPLAHALGAAAGLLAGMLCLPQGQPSADSHGIPPAAE